MRDNTLIRYSKLLPLFHREVILIEKETDNHIATSQPLSTIHLLIVIETSIII